VYVIAAVIGLGTGGIVVMIYAIFPDIPDVDELNTGQRREGIYSSLISLSRKLASAVGLFIVSNAIGLAGYVKPVEEIVDGATRLIDQPQSDGFILMLRLIFALVPLFLVILALYCASRYPLNGEVHERLKRLLARRRSGEQESPEMAAEAADLTRALIG
jgi:Na+/melibiose symporter-like transporter